MKITYKFIILAVFLRGAYCAFVDTAREKGAEIREREGEEEEGQGSIENRAFGLLEWDFVILFLPKVKNRTLILLKNV